MTENGTKRSTGVSLDADLMDAINKKRGYESFSSFVNRHLREVLGLPERV